MGKLLFTIAMLLLGFIPSHSLSTEDLSPEETEMKERYKRIARDLYLSPSPIYQDFEANHFEARYFENLERDALNEAFRDPSIKPLVDEGRAEIQKAIEEAYALARTSALKERAPFLSSEAELLQESVGRLKNRLNTDGKIKEQRALWEAQEIVRSRHRGNFDPREYHQEREIHREKERLLLSSQGLQKNTRITPAAFARWRAEEIVILAKKQREFLLEYFRLAVELEPGRFMVGVGNENGFVPEGAETNRALSIEDLKGARLVKSEISFRERSRRDAQAARPSRKRQLFHSSDWVLELKDGRRLIPYESGIGAHMSGGDDYRELKHHTFEMRGLNPFKNPNFSLSRDSLHKWLRYFFSGKASEEIERVIKRINKMPHQKSAITAESLLAPSRYSRPFKEDFFYSLTRGNSSRWIIYLRGLIRDPHYWKKREALAKHIGAAKFPLGRDVPPWQDRNFFKDLKKSFGGIGSDSADEIERPVQNAVQINTNLSPSNSPKDFLTDEILFKTDKILPGTGPDFYELFDMSKPLEISEVVPLHARPSLTVKTQVPAQIIGDSISLPSPRGYALSEITMRFVGGRELVHGTDYDLVRQSGTGAYLVKLKSQDSSLVQFSAGFSKEAESPIPIPAKLAKLDSARILSLAKDLRESGLNALADDLEATKGNISLWELEKIFQKANLYSFNPEPGLREPKGKFSEFSRFANEFGQACFQCDGSNSLFQKFLGHLFAGDPEIEIRGHGGFQSSYRSLRQKDLHATTSVSLGGRRWYLDTTPFATDRSAPRPHAKTKDKWIPEEDVRPRDGNGQVAFYRQRLELARKEYVQAAQESGAPLQAWEPWIRVAKVTQALEGYIAKGDPEQFSLDLQKHFPSEAFKAKSHAEVLDFLSEYAKKELSTLRKLHEYAQKNPDVAGSETFRSFTLFRATEQRLALLQNAGDFLTESSMADYQVKTLHWPSKAASCPVVFGRLGP